MRAGWPVTLYQHAAAASPCRVADRLFDTGGRVDPQSAEHGEDSFSFMNRVDQPFWSRIREELERWFSAYPREHAAAAPTDAWNAATVWPRIWVNPWATHPLAPKLPFATATANEQGTVQYGDVTGSAPALLGLAEDWPGPIREGVTVSGKPEVTRANALRGRSGGGSVQALRDRSDRFDERLV